MRINEIVAQYCKEDFDDVPDAEQQLDIDLLEDDPEYDVSEWDDDLLWTCWDALGLYPERTENQERAYQALTKEKDARGI